MRNFIRRKKKEKGQEVANLTEEELQKIDALLLEEIYSMTQKNVPVSSLRKNRAISKIDEPGGFE